MYFFWSPSLILTSLNLYLKKKKIEPSLPLNNIYADHLESSILNTQCKLHCNRKENSQQNMVGSALHIVHNVQGIMYPPLAHTWGHKSYDHNTAYDIAYCTLHISYCIYICHRPLHTLDHKSYKTGVALNAQMHLICGSVYIFVTLINQTVQQQILQERCWKGIFSKKYQRKLSIPLMVLTCSSKNLQIFR